MPGRTAPRWAFAPKYVDLVTTSPMKPTTAHSYSPLQDIPGENGEPNAVTDPTKLEGSLKPTQARYTAVSTVQTAKLLFSIIIANCFCSGVICVCLWGFALSNNLAPWEKRGFNTLALLLSTTLAFGIGFLFDRILLLARGSILQSKAHCRKEVWQYFSSQRTFHFCVRALTNK